MGVLMSECKWPATIEQVQSLQRTSILTLIGEVTRCWSHCIQFLRFSSLKAVLHCNFLSNLSHNAVATQVAEELHGVTCYLCNLSHNIFVACNVARSRTQFYFLQWLQQLPIAVAQCNHPFSNLSHNALPNPPIRILIILSSVLLGHNFASCWQSHCKV